MSYDYRKLRGRIIEKFSTQQAFAIAMGWSERTLSLKMNSKRYWNQVDIMKACELLNIAKDDAKDYFFKQNVQEG